jgi:hypothetical protein
MSVVSRSQKSAIYEPQPTFHREQRYAYRTPTASQDTLRQQRSRPSLVGAKPPHVSPFHIRAAINDKQVTEKCVMDLASAIHEALIGTGVVQGELSYFVLSKLCKHAHFLSVDMNIIDTSRCSCCSSVIWRPISTDLSSGYRSLGWPSLPGFY